MQRTRKLCAIMIDSIGREIFLQRASEDVDDSGWPISKGNLNIKGGHKVRGSFHLQFFTYLNDYTKDIIDTV